MIDKSVRIGLIAGSGHLPEMIEHECRNRGQHIKVISLSVANRNYAGTSWKSMSIFKPREILDEFAADDCHTLCFAGGIERPFLNPFKLDWFSLRQLPKLIMMFLKGDGGLLRGVTDILEKNGFKIVGADELLENAVISAGALGKHSPSDDDLQDIIHAKEAAFELGSRDIGQAVIVQNNVVVAEEDRRGTEAMIKGFATQNSGKNRSGVLYKAPKVNQDKRMDLPAIGPDTIQQAHKANLAGVALEASGALLINRIEIIKEADRLGLFVFGYDDHE